MTLPVFLVPSLPASDTFVLDGPEGRHAATVRRLRAGESLVLSDGTGSLVRCSIVAVDRDSLQLSVVERWTEPEPSPRVVLAQALIKSDRGELAVELATEAGVDGVVPWRASRCIAKWEAGPRGDKALARWRSTVREAAKQARRSRVPTVSEPVGTAGLAQLVSQSALTLVLHESANTRLADIELPASGDLLLVVGPEGGITDEELTALTTAGGRAVRLGTTVLRASTAGVVALGALGALTKRW
ncbi:ribosomal RNA small subunit methyltransferase E [Lentzea sp. NBRC 105346]|uniref:16S rRNA (uracil(1498)-N(3))-methyltransferase n=1 Tax=Lentzea sp. NBRC 105346 TaxID=3032205 RepID=UPI0025521CB4|nr:16S rRNA (uracil(1498)-N(3))-methyltransferase [Lentzea sp. NBRC 105346]GLZ33989.1 ribosomal RNA small subunit methyltransferase E [Lentzea sp. NBRC 105346]